MQDIAVKRFETADESRQFQKGRFDVIRFGDITIGRATYQPGWRWSEHVGPQVNATRCTSPHVGLVVTGAATAAFDDGHTTILRAGDVFCIPPVPHDSWVVGDEPYVSLHLFEADGYAAAKRDTGEQEPEGDPHCFVCGFSNPVALGATFRRDSAGGSATTYVARREHEGWPGLLHGGVLFALLDDAVGWAARYDGQRCVTGRAEIRYRRPVLTSTSLGIVGRIRRHGRVLAATAEACRVDDETPVADLDATLFALPRPD